MTTLLRFSTSRLGMSMLEVMIAVAILASALSIMLGTIYTMHQGRAAIDEEIKVQAIAQNMVERLQGARWDDLGKNLPGVKGNNAWSWHRRATKQATYTPTMVNPPLQEAELEASGILTEKSGVPGLQVYLEYYQMRVIDVVSSTLNADPTLDPRKVWGDLVGDPVSGTEATRVDNQIFLPEAVGSMNLSNLDPSVIMRILVRWEPSVGGVRWHEVIIARRR